MECAKTAKIEIQFTKYNKKHIILVSIEFKEIKIKTYVTIAIS
jgi:hypothetical protein